MDRDSEQTESREGGAELEVYRPRWNRTGTTRGAGKARCQILIRSSDGNFMKSEKTADGSIVEAVEDDECMGAVDVIVDAISFGARTQRC
jgi:hypothetical protein